MTGHSSKLDVAGYNDADDQSLDVVCNLLANQRRQYVLECLMDRTQATTLAELAEDVAVRENDRPSTELPNETVQTISTSLYHTHLPKLADAGAVEYDSDCDRIQVSETTDLVERVLSLSSVGGEVR